MSDCEEHPPTRRDFLGAAASGAVLVSGLSGAKAAAPDAGLIRDENAKPGADDWQLTRVRPDASQHRTPWVEGYCSKQSARAGESIDVMVSTDPPRPFRIEVFRMGYYGGKGARLMAQLGPFEGKVQPAPTPGPKDVHDCRWQPSTKLELPGDWPSGVYLGRLTTITNDDDEPYC